MIGVEGRWRRNGLESRSRVSCRCRKDWLCGGLAAWSSEKDAYRPAMKWQRVVLSGNGDEWTIELTT
jgi:hypothetical protein